MFVIAIPVNRDLGLENRSKSNYGKGLVMEEIKDVIKVHKNGRVERSSSTIESVTPFLPPNLDVTARDVYIDRPTNVWARTYVPKRDEDYKFPLLVYFHGGGFCVGSTSWKCYHEFLGNLSSKARCVIVSVNYRLAPENRLPAAYEDGIKALMWVKQQENGPSSEYWTKYCEFSSIFLGGDSAGANIAYNVALKLEMTSPINIKGIIMAQPFFGGEKRTNSEKSVSKSSKSTLNMTASDTYWRLALPVGANRDHPWCNPANEGVQMLENTRVMVCVAEEDVVRDRNTEFCSALGKANNQVKRINYEGVGHGFQIVDKSQVSQMRKHQMMDDIVNFINA
ncbi:putative carboxylesterase 6 [Silene latifolia]|uniref:putative carboxylesterase 6 n=1 Tax=Silene latifolia TaxID=37657 RepID=UPI003D7806F7